MSAWQEHPTKFGWYWAGRGPGLEPTIIRVHDVGGIYEPGPPKWVDAITGKLAVYDKVMPITPVPEYPK